MMGALKMGESVAQPEWRSTHVADLTMIVELAVRLPSPALVKPTAGHEGNRR